MVIVVNAIFNNISVILLRSVLLVEETGVSGGNHKPASSHWQTLSHNVVSSIPRLSGFWTQNVSGDMHRLHNHTITTNDGSNIKTLSNSRLSSYNQKYPFLTYITYPLSSHWVLNTIWMINNIYSQHIKKNIWMIKKPNPIRTLPEMIKINPFLFKQHLRNINYNLSWIFLGLPTWNLAFKSTLIKVKIISENLTVTLLVEEKSSNNRIFNGPEYLTANFGLI